MSPRRGHRDHPERRSKRATTRDENIADIEDLLLGCGALTAEQLRDCLNIPMGTLEEALEELEREGRIRWRRMIVHETLDEFGHPLFYSTDRIELL